MQIKIKSAELTWKSNDGTRKIYSVVAEEGTFKTFSDAIGSAQPGATLNVEVYEREGKRGPEKFLKSAQGQTPGPNKVYAPIPGQTPDDRNRGFAAAYAKDICVAYIEKGKEWDPKLFNDAANIILAFMQPQPPKNNAPTLEDVVEACKKEGIYEKCRTIGITKTDIVAYIDKGIRLDEILSDLKKAVAASEDTIPM